MGINADIPCTAQGVTILAGKVVQGVLSVVALATVSTCQLRWGSLGHPKGMLRLSDIFASDSDLLAPLFLPVCQTSLSVATPVSVWP